MWRPQWRRAIDDLNDLLRHILHSFDNVFSHVLHTVGERLLARKPNGLPKSLQRTIVITSLSSCTGYKTPSGDKVTALEATVPRRRRLKRRHVAHPGDAVPNLSDNVHVPCLAPASSGRCGSCGPRRVPGRAGEMVLRPGSRARRSSAQRSRGAFVARVRCPPPAALPTLDHVSALRRSRVGRGRNRIAGPALPCGLMWAWLLVLLATPRRLPAASRPRRDRSHPVPCQWARIDHRARGYCGRPGQRATNAGWTRPVADGPGPDGSPRAIYRPARRLADDLHIPDRGRLGGASGGAGAHGAARLTWPARVATPPSPTIFPTPSRAHLRHAAAWRWLA